MRINVLTYVKMNTLEEQYYDEGFSPEWVQRAVDELRDLTDREIDDYCPYLHWKEYHHIIKCVYESYVSAE